MTTDKAFDIEELYATDEQIQQNYDRLKKSVKAQRAFPITYRKEQLRQIAKFVDNEREAICEALSKDLHKGYSEGILMELMMIKNELLLFDARLDEWTSPKYVSKSLLYAMDDLHIVRDPYGMVLIIGAWNYPIALTLQPLAGAIAGGNCAVLKPSELAPHCAKIVTDLVTKYLDPECYVVMNGAAKETQKMLEQRWDHIFYTGSNKVAKYILKAASEHLTPVTLELGGKNPTYVHSDVDLTVTAQRIAWAKFVNVGQTCLAPDFVLCHKDVVLPLTEALITTIKKFYTDDPKTFADYGRIVSKNHLNRIAKLLDNTKGQVVVGGERDEDARYIAPTVVKDVELNDSLLDDEIFGPILPIIQVDSPEHALRIINDREKCLSLYTFCKDMKIAKMFRDRTSSGSYVSNDAIVHAGCITLPFGGVGHSGTGSYHGKFSFDNFTHPKSVLIKSQGNESMNMLRYPPISRKSADRLFYLATHRDGLGRVLGWAKTVVMVSLIIAITLLVDRIALRSKL